MKTSGVGMFMTICFVAIAAFALPLFAQSPRKLSLDDALRIGQENNRALKISAAKVVAAEAKANEASTSLLPSVTLHAGYQRLSDVDPFQVTVPFAPQPITIAPVVLNSYSARVSLQQPLFTGFKLSSNANAADLMAAASAFDSRNDQADLTLNITVAYWTLYQVGKTREFVQGNFSRLEAIETDTRNLLRTGLATRNDLLKVQLQLNNARLMTVDAANDHELATMNLNNLIGLPLGTEILITSMPEIPVEPEGKPEGPGFTSPTLTHYTELALGSRPDVLAMQSRMEASRNMVRAAQAHWWPQLYLTGGYTYARPNLRYQPTRDEFKGTWDVGVQLQFNVWSWGATAHQTEQAEAALRQTELALEQMKENVTLDVQRQKLALSRSSEKVKIAHLSVEQARENQRIMNDKYKQGLATSSDVLDANVSLLQAETSYSAAYVEFQIAQARWNKAIGIVPPAGD